MNILPISVAVICVYVFFRKASTLRIVLRGCAISEKDNTFTSWKFWKFILLISTYAFLAGLALQYTINSETYHLVAKSSLLLVGLVILIFSDQVWKSFRWCEGMLGIIGIQIKVHRARQNFVSRIYPKLPRIKLLQKLWLELM